MLPEKGDALGNVFSFFKGESAGRGQTKLVKPDHSFTQQVFTEGFLRARDDQPSKTNRIPVLMELRD